MATSIKRLIIMFIFINLIFGLVIDFTSGSRMINIADESSNIENWTGDFKDNYVSSTTPDSQVVQLDKTFGNVKYGMGKIFSLMINGINPIKHTTCETTRCSSSYQLIIESIANWVITLVNMIIILEVMYLIYAKKYD